MIEGLGNFRLDKITDIVNFLDESEKVPDEMIEPIFIALPKKPGNQLQSTQNNKPYEP